MKSKMVSRGIVSGLVLSLLSAGAATAAGAVGNERMSRIEPAAAISQRRAEFRKIETFRTEKTNDWLCAYVSPFFCTNAFPTLTSSPEPPKSTPVRGRP